jgi:hypothetical protein
MRKIFSSLLFAGFLFSLAGFSQTAIPNGDFEQWKPVSGNYQDPLYWDTPNPEIANIPFIGITVVSKSTDHESGAYSVKLETKHLSFPPLDIPGFITLGDFTMDLTAGTYSITGGVQITDNPTHLKGYYKFFPVGGDSCVIGIGLFRFNAGIRDTIGSGYMSVKDSVTDWTPFSAWIDYTISGAPDSMNIFAISSAEEVGMHVGTNLYIDNLFLDYTVSVNDKDPGSCIDTYLDRETKRLLVFFDFPENRQTSLALYNMMGTRVADLPAMMTRNERRILSYGSLPQGVYLLEVVHDGQKYCRKFFLNF